MTDGCAVEDLTVGVAYPQLAAPSGSGSASLGHWIWVDANASLPLTDTSGRLQSLSVQSLDNSECTNSPFVFHQWKYCVGIAASQTRGVNIATSTQDASFGLGELRLPACVFWRHRSTGAENRPDLARVCDSGGGGE